MSSRDSFHGGHSRGHHDGHSGHDCDSLLGSYFPFSHTDIDLPVVAVVLRPHIGKSHNEEMTLVSNHDDALVPVYIPAHVQRIRFDLDYCSSNCYEGSRAHIEGLRDGLRCGWAEEEVLEPQWSLAEGVPQTQELVGEQVWWGM